MCGGSYVGRGMRHGMWSHASGREYVGRDVEKMSPGTRISAALSVLLPRRCTPPEVSAKDRGYANFEENFFYELR
jgi:hypothetical protein